MLQRGRWHMGVLGRIHAMTLQSENLMRSALAAALLLAPLVAVAQPVQQSAQQAFASALASNLSGSLGELDKANQKIAELQKENETLKAAAAKTAEADKH